MSAAELSSLFRKARVPTSSHRHLIPDEIIQQILSPDRIRNLLQDELHLEFYKLDQYVDLVCKRATKVLSILICIGHLAALVDHFLHPELFDNRLPLASSDLPDEFGQAFLDGQQHFLAPSITNGIFKDWKSEVILPFSFDEPIDEAVGSFASVHKIQFVSGFQKLVEKQRDGGKEVQFARKELKTRRTRAGLSAFQSEKQVLELLGLMNHPNIIPLLASYIYDNRFNMIFPLAAGDLESLLSEKEDRFGVKGDNLWLQVLGITSAIDQLHNFENKNAHDLSLSKIGYHHDLKPQNILIRDGVFLLADFGLARLKDANEGSSTDHKYGALTYGAPESQDHVPKGHIRVSRALDIWSWGCILIEIITLELLGRGSVERFRAFRKTEIAMRVDHYFHDMKNLKPEVEKWLQYLQGLSLSGNSVSNGKMIVKILAIVKKMLSTAPHDRPCSRVVLRNFHRCLVEEGTPTLKLHAKITEGVDHSHQETRSKERCRAPSDDLYAIDSDDGFSRLALSENADVQRIENIMESLEIFFDKDHPVMRALAQSIDQQDMPGAET